MRNSDDTNNFEESSLICEYFSKFFYFDSLKSLEDCINEEQPKLQKMKVGDLLCLRKQREIYCLVDSNPSLIKNFVLVARKGE